MRIQTVLPGPTAIELRLTVGLRFITCRATLITAEDLVDAALAYLDQGEVVTMPGLRGRPEDMTCRSADRSNAARTAMAEALRERFRHPATTLFKRRGQPPDELDPANSRKKLVGEDHLVLFGENPAGRDKNRTLRRATI